MRKDAAMHDENFADARPQRGRPQVRPDAETRDIIYEAARHVFAEKGFAATSMEAIARAAGVSTKTVYRLIENKAVLFEQMVRQRIDRFVNAVNLSACENSQLRGRAGRRADRVRRARARPRGHRHPAHGPGRERRVPANGGVVLRICDAAHCRCARRLVEVAAGRGLIALDDPDEAAGMLLGMLIFEPQRAVWFGHRAAPTRGAIMRAGAELRQAILARVSDLTARRRG